MPTKCEIKYVIINHTFPIVFILQQHSDMKVHGNITSAAFYKIVNGKVETYGRSTSLSIGPEPDDAYLLELFLGLN
jgi:hypothetical protein